MTIVSGGFHFAMGAVQGAGRSDARDRDRDGLGSFQEHLPAGAAHDVGRAHTDQYPFAGRK